MVNTIAEFTDLVGSRLSAICFVMDYVEFNFDGPVLRSLSSPVLLDQGRRHEFPRPSSRDALCELIGRPVEQAADEPDRLVLRLAEGAVLEIPKADPRAGPEVAHFIPMIMGERDGAAMIIWENLVSTRSAPERLEPE